MISKEKFLGLASLRKRLSRPLVLLVDLGIAIFELRLQACIMMLS